MSNEKDIKVWKCICCCASRIIIAVLIAACLGFSICVFNSMKNCEITVNETTRFALDYNKETDETTTDNVKPPRPPHHGKVVQKKMNMYPVFCMTYFVVLAGTLAALIVLFIKDDSCFRCTKLDELHEIKENLLKGDFKDSKDSKDETVEENHSEETPVNSNAVKKTNKNTKTETTDNRAALLRHYMDCVAEL